MEEHIGKRVNHERVEEALDTGASKIATGCPFCRVMMTDGVDDRAEDMGKEKAEVLDVAQLLLGSLDTSSVTLPEKGTPQRKPQEARAAKVESVPTATVERRPRLRPGRRRQAGRPRRGGGTRQPRSAAAAATRRRACGIAGGAPSVPAPRRLRPHRPKPKTAHRQKRPRRRAAPEPGSRVSAWPQAPSVPAPRRPPPRRGAERGSCRSARDASRSASRRQARAGGQGTRHRRGRAQARRAEGACSTYGETRSATAGTESRRRICPCA